MSSESLYNLILPPILSLHSLIGVSLLLWRRKQEVIAKRGYLLVLFSTLALNYGIWTVAYFTSDAVSVTSKPCIALIWLSCFFLPMWLLPYPLRAVLQNSQYIYNQKKLRPKEVNDKDWLFKFYPFFTSRKASLILTLVVAIVNAILTAVITYTDPDLPEFGSYHQCYGRAIYLEAAWCLLFMIDVIAQSYVLWHTHDAYELKRELRLFVILFPISFAAWMIINYIPNMPDFSVVVLFVTGMVSVNTSLFFPVVLSFQRQWRRQTSSMNSENLKMNNRELFLFCLDTPALLEALKRYCVELWCAENIQFYIMVTGFKKSIEEGGAKVLAEEIVATFLSDRCPTPVNIDDKTRKEILQNFQAGNIKDSLFDEAEVAVLQQLRQDTFSKFRLSGRLATEWKNAGLGDLNEAVTFEVEPSKRLSLAATELIVTTTPSDE